ncbi:hypothetical protein DFH06DRAFT_981811 [Mycena polygramma]|nr:hypothetical protein DFH06DRAFT_981811 [Mycena polygramma]
MTKQEELINAYEAEEERIMNVLSKKLEQLREEKIELENVLEAESESHVNRLTRELSSLRLAQQQLAGIGVSPTTGPSDPSLEIMLAALQRENEALRSRLADTERDYVRISRLNEVYREELLEHRNRLGLPVDHLIGMASSDPYSQPTHQRPPSAYSSNTSSPTNSVLHYPTNRPTNGVPIPRPAAQIRRIGSNNISEGNTPLSHSPSSSSDSPFPFSPVTSPNPTSFVSVSSNVTSPPTSYNGGVTFGAPSRGLTYPSVPPPSLSSSFGSPTVSYHMPHRDREHSLSPVEPQSRRNSIRRGARVVESGSLWSRSTSQSRRNSMERGGRVAETGQLIPRTEPSLVPTQLTRINGKLMRSHGLLLTPMSYGYPGQQGQSSQYPDDYVAHSAPPTPRDPNYQQPWEQQQQESQHSQHSQVSDMSDMSQQALEQALEQPQQHHQPLSLPPPTPQQPHFQQLEEPQRLVPSTQIPRGTHDLTPIRLHPPGRSPPVEIQPVMLQVDTAVRSTTRPASRARHQYHPYQRPASASESSAAAQRREIEAHHHVRFASQANTPQGSALQSPAAGRQTEFAQPGAPFVPPQETPAADGRRYLIRTDTHYDPGTRVFTALLELPGMKKSDLRITLATTPFNRVRQLIVSGTSRAPFPPGSGAASGPVLRERKYGRFARAFPVPADTKPEDVDAAMEDGVLRVKVSCGVPAASADEREIPIR